MGSKSSRPRDDDFVVVRSERTMQPYGSSRSDRTIRVPSVGFGQDHFASTSDYSRPSYDTLQRAQTVQRTIVYETYGRLEAASVAPVQPTIIVRERAPVQPTIVVRKPAPAVPALPSSRPVQNRVVDRRLCCICDKKTVVPYRPESWHCKVCKADYHRACIFLSATTKQEWPHCSMCKSKFVPNILECKFASEEVLQAMRKLYNQDKTSYPSRRK